MAYCSLNQRRTPWKRTVWTCALTMCLICAICFSVSTWPGPQRRETLKVFGVTSITKDKRGSNRSEVTRNYDVNHYQVYNETIVNTPTHGSDERLKYTRCDMKTVAKDIFHRVPDNFLPNYRSPCWFEGDQIWCLPYFYIIGFHKCGTTDIFNKLVFHPDVLNLGKEPHWWAMRRPGKAFPNFSIHRNLIAEVQNLPGASNVSSFAWYLNWFKYQVLSAVQNTTKPLSTEGGEIVEYHPQVFGDGSVSTLTHVIFKAWDDVYPEGEDPDLLPYLMHNVQPHAKIIITLRDPVARFGSMYFQKFKGNPRDMHSYAVKTIECATDCISQHSVRHCAYFSHCGKVPLTPVYLGVYVDFIRPWALLYGKDNLLISKMEDRITNPVTEYKRILSYMELDVLPDEACANITTRVFNKNRAHHGEMLKETRTLLREFYRPFNRQMAAFMNDDTYLFGY